MISDEQRMMRLEEDDNTSLEKVNSTGAAVEGPEREDQFNFTFFKEKRQSADLHAIEQHSQKTQNSLLIMPDPYVNVSNLLNSAQQVHKKRNEMNLSGGPADDEKNNNNYYYKTIIAPPP